MMAPAELLDGLVRVNLAGSAAILAVLALRKPVRRLAGAKAAYGLWAAVPLVAAAGLLPARTVEIVMTEAAPVLASGPDYATPVLALWALGAAGSLAWVGWSHRRFTRQLGRMLRRPDGALQSVHSTLGPAVIGIVRPRIVLPADFEARFSDREQAVVIAHEAGHVRAGHVQFTALAVLVQCLNWLNPLVHLAMHTLRIDQELACDEAVIGRHPHHRRTYAEAMLKTQFGGLNPALGCSWPAKAGDPLKERIAMLKRPKPGRARRLAGAASLAVLTLAGGYAAWAAQPPRAVAVPAPPERPVEVAQPARTAPAARAVPAPPAPPAPPTRRSRAERIERPPPGARPLRGDRPHRPDQRHPAAGTGPGRAAGHPRRA